MSISIVEKKLC